MLTIGVTVHRMSNGMAYGIRSLPLQPLQQGCTVAGHIPMEQFIQEQNLPLSSVMLGVEECVYFEDGWVYGNNWHFKHVVPYSLHKSLLHIL